MLGKLFQRIHEAERRFSKSFGQDISTPAARRQAKWHFYLSDHGLLRTVWTNMDQIAPGVWRSNQPSPARLRKIHAMGIRTILNLRGQDSYAHYLFEKETCDALGIELIDHKIYARSLVAREKFLKLFDIFDELETKKPFLFHCKSGADRAGLVAAMWLMDKEGASVDDARRMLGLRYAHLKHTRTGLMDHVLDVYEADAAQTPMSLRQWFHDRYDPKAITASFERKQARA